MEDYSNQNGHSGYDPKYNPQSYGPNYDYGSYGNDPYGEGGPNKSVKGLKIMIVIMALILAALSAIYFLQVKQMKDDFAIERDTLTRQLTSLMNDYDTLKTMNDTLAVHYEGVKHQADSLLDKLQKERRLSYSKIRNYEKQMSYMRTVMEGYIRQIDSLEPDQQEARQREYDDPQNDHHLQAAGRDGRGKVAGTVDRRCVRAP